MRHRVAALASVALLFAAGCGGGAASTSASAPPHSTGSVSDPAQAEAPLPRASDFPAGWMSGVDPAALAIRCAPDESGIVKTAYAGPESFTNAAGFPALTGTATMWKTPQDAVTAFRRAASPKAFDCLAREFRRDLHFRALKGLHVGPATLTVPPLPDVGDEFRAEQVEVALSYNGATAFYYVDYVFVRVGRGVASIDGLQRNDPFDNDLLGQIATTVSARGSRPGPA